MTITERCPLSNTPRLASRLASAFLVALAATACSGEGENPAGTATVSEEQAMAVDSAAARAECLEGVEPLSLGTWVDLSQEARVVVHSLEGGLTYEQMGQEMHAAEADVELCAGYLELDAPFTNRSAFSLCSSGVETGAGGDLERYVFWGAPDPMATAREPGLPSTFEVPSGECQRGWVTLRTLEDEVHPQLHVVIYDTSFYTDTPEDQVRIAWTVE